MNKIKLAAGTSLASLAMVLGLAMPASAQQTTNCQAGAVGVNACPSTHVDQSKHITLGDCAGIIQNTTTQVQTTTAGNSQNNTGGVNTGSGSSNQANDGGATATGAQSNGVVFTPDCSTTNVTNVNQMAAASTKSATASASTAQVSTAPKGGVGAGAGGAASSSVAAIVGLVSSVGVAGLGLRLRNWEL